LYAILINFDCSYFCIGIFDSIWLLEYIIKILHGINIEGIAFYICVRLCVWDTPYYYNIYMNFTKYYEKYIAAIDSALCNKITENFLS